MLKKHYLLKTTVLLWKRWYIFFQESLMNSSKEQNLFEIEILCNIIDIFTVSFDQFNASLLNFFF